jgi:hypothetical protein
MKACRLYRWAADRYHTLPRKAGKKLDRKPHFVIHGPNPTFEEKGNALKELEQAGVEPFYIFGTNVVFVDPMRFWPESVPNLHCPDCGSMERVIRDGVADSLRAITSLFCSDFMLASRHKCKECPRSIGETTSFLFCSYLLAMKQLEYSTWTSPWQTLGLHSCRCSRCHQEKMSWLRIILRSSIVCFTLKSNNE